MEVLKERTKVMEVKAKRINRVEVVEKPVTTIQVEMDVDTAQVLWYVFQKIGGHPDTTVRGQINHMRNVLSKALGNDMPKFDFGVFNNGSTYVVNGKKERLPFKGGLSALSR